MRRDMTDAEIEAAAIQAVKATRALERARKAVR
jgi:hypothetical protein